MTVGQQLLKIEQNKVVSKFIREMMSEDKYSLRARSMVIVEKTPRYLLDAYPELGDNPDIATREMCDSIKSQLYDFMGFMDRGIARIKGVRAIELVVEDHRRSVQ